MEVDELHGGPDVVVAGDAARGSDSLGRQAGALNFVQGQVGAADGAGSDQPLGRLVRVHHHVVQVAAGHRLERHRKLRPTHREQVAHQAGHFRAVEVGERVVVTQLRPRKLTQTLLHLEIILQLIGKIHRTYIFKF